MSYRFGKTERLKSQKIISGLYGSPHISHFRHPYHISLLFTELPAEIPAQVLISVSSRKFKKAVDRNRLRRQTREIYRYLKPWLYAELKKLKKSAAILITYAAREPMPFAEMQTALQTAFEQLLLKTGQDEKTAH